ncbi:hypothetical protein Mapa_009209 [Marchantia paleacea]|nr:hypothetical protein Mapa_009209 [Marchantia paleacea]
MEKVKLCPKCDQLLNPKEDKVERRLLYACNHCSYQVPVENNIFFLRKYRTTVTGEFPPLKKNAVLPCSKGVQCVKCKNWEATFFKSVVRDEGCNQAHLVLFLACSSAECGHQWATEF